ncbi:hypothetical protein B5V02_09770 [Mesorhizobium kowhaii]|uniref:Uncharacterized protein n=1 Tax=Mesorhizobium kowhaii TaxID=1300272 RepID=A0A2W7C6X4_9HYPH|nr:hypothetical protein B5V02_09770 [Mesorhizobium kowhaii]
MLVSAAPHLPAGILSRIVTGRGTLSPAGFANHQRCKKGVGATASFFLPVTIRGEMPGRAMRVGAKIGRYLLSCPGLPHVK